MIPFAIALRQLDSHSALTVLVCFFRLIEVCSLYFVVKVWYVRSDIMFDVIPRATAVAKHYKVLSKNSHLITRTKVFRDQVKEVNGPTGHMD